MSKVAIFVEGQTEQIFFERLIEEIAGKKNLNTRLLKFSGRVSKRVVHQILETSIPSPIKKHECFIYDSSQDESVVSDIKEQYNSLVLAGFDAIIGIRDLFPRWTFEELSKVREFIGVHIKVSTIKPLFVLGVMECEAWFIAEYKHFSKVHPSLTLENIIQILGKDPSTEDMQMLQTPAKEIDKIYQTIGLSYNKNKDIVQNIVDKLDYTEIYLNFPKKFPDILNLIKLLDSLFI